MRRRPEMGVMTLECDEVVDWQHESYRVSDQDISRS